MTAACAVLSFGHNKKGNVRVRVNRLRPAADGLDSGIHLYDSYDGLLLISHGDSNRFILYSHMTRSYEVLPDYDQTCNFRDWKSVRDD